MSLLPVRLRVRNDDLDVNGHVRQDVYLAYAGHARWEIVRAAGVSFEKLHLAGFGPVDIETTVRFRRELMLGDEIEVSCEFVYGDGKTSRVHQRLQRLDGTLVAEVQSVSGIIDLHTRRLVPDPRAAWRSVADDPSQLGL
jgi:acyl-CoA thioester hydrolase